MLDLNRPTSVCTYAGFAARLADAVELRHLVTWCHRVDS
jgi:hypothetical protein